jgi:hypothetical protein
MANAAVLKTAVRKDLGVRIPRPPCDVTTICGRDSGRSTAHTAFNALHGPRSTHDGGSASRGPTKPSRASPQPLKLAPSPFDRPPQIPE